MPLLVVGGALGFWLANLAISLTPLAADYRSALSIAYLPMLLEAILGGLVIGAGVSYCLLRFYDRVPTGGPMTKSLLLSLVALAVVTLGVEVPAKLLTTTDEAWRYFVVGTLFNVVRILALGVVIGVLYGRLERRRRA